MSILIDCKDTPYRVGDNIVATMTVIPIGFISFCAAGAAAASSDDKATARNLFRERIQRQVTAKTVAGAVVPLDSLAVSAMPIPVAMKVKAALSDVMAEAEGASKFKVLSDAKADGITSPIHVQLGSPLKAADGKLITELEFQASTLGQIEDAIVADNSLDQTVAILAIAKPIMSEGNLISLPSWALDQISLQDGIGIMNNVSKRFLLNAQ